MTSAIISLISALVGAMVTLIITTINNRTNCKQIFADNVSKSRMKWINDFRDEISSIVAFLKVNLSINVKTANKELYLKQRFDVEKTRSRLLTRLNCNTNKPGNEHNQELTDLLTGINFDSLTKKQTELDISELQKLTKIILEFEWQRVKSEASGKLKYANTKE